MSCHCQGDDNTPSPASGNQTSDKHKTKEIRDDTQHQQQQRAGLSRANSVDTEDKSPPPPPPPPRVRVRWPLLLSTWYLSTTGHTHYHWTKLLSWFLGVIFFDVNFAITCCGIIFLNSSLHIRRVTSSTKFNDVVIICMSQDCWACKVTTHGLEGQGLILGCDTENFMLTTTSRPILMPGRPLIQWQPWVKWPGH